jgi:hypothetical protein
MKLDSNRKSMLLAVCAARSFNSVSVAGAGQKPIKTHPGRFSIRSMPSSLAAFNASA